MNIRGGCVDAVCHRRGLLLLTLVPVSDGYSMVQITDDSAGRAQADWVVLTPTHPHTLTHKRAFCTILCRSASSGSGSGDNLLRLTNPCKRAAGLGRRDHTCGVPAPHLLRRAWLGVLVSTRRVVFPVRSRRVETRRLTPACVTLGWMSEHAVLFDKHLSREAGRDFTGLLVKGGISNQVCTQAGWGALVTEREITAG